MNRVWLLAALAAASDLACTVEKDIRPTIRIVQPVDGSTMNTSSLFLTVAVTGFTLQGGPDTGTPYVGHWHLFVDDQPGIAVVSTSVTLTEIPPGVHHFFAELSNQNDVPVSGVPVDEATVTFPATAPSLALSAPASGATVNSSSVDAALSVTNFVLDSANIGQANIAGHGHYHVFLGALDLAHYVEQDALTSLTVTDLDTSAIGDPDTSLWFALANDDHTLLDPPVFDVRALSIPTGAPRLAIVSPAPGDAVGASFTLSVAPANFSLVDFSGAPADSAGQGHFRVLLDGSSLGAAYQTTSAGWSSGASGSHEVRVELLTNSGSPLSPPVVDKVRITAP